MYMYNVEELIAMAAEKRASDVHLIAGLPPKCRIDGEIVNLADVPLSKETVTPTVWNWQENI